MIAILLYISAFLVLDGVSDLFTRSKRMQFQAITAFILLMGFFGFRGLSVLNDTAHYYRAMQHILSGIAQAPWFYYDPDLKFEIGFQMFMNVIGKLFPHDPYMLTILTSLIVTISYIAFFKRYCRNILFPLFLCLGTMMLPGVYAAERQSIAIGLTFIVLYLWQNKRYRLAICIAVLAFFFHKSSYIIFIPILLSRFKLTDKNVIIFCLIGLVIGLNIYALFNIIGYSDNGYVMYGEGREATPLAQILIMLLGILEILVYRIVNGSFEPKDTTTSIDHLFVCFALTGIVVNIWSSFCLPLGRYSMYFSPYAISLLCRAIAMSKQSMRGLLKIATVVMAISYASIIMTYRNDWHHLLPYSFYDYSETNRQTHFGY